MVITRSKYLIRLERGLSRARRGASLITSTLSAEADRPIPGERGVGGREMIRVNTCVMRGQGHYIRITARFGGSGTRARHVRARDA